MTYSEFLARKKITDHPSGFAGLGAVDIPDAAFPFQRDIVRWALQRGRSAVWADCGLGKSLIQLAWASHVARETGSRVLVVAPLAVAAQTVREAVKFGIRDVVQARHSNESSAAITVTNYEMLQHFESGDYSGVVLDESSILKSFDGRTRNQIIEAFGETPFRLACTATPAPNDYEELGNHAEFLGVMTRAEMLSCFFVHDGKRTSQWRLKKHAANEFWAWICTWAVTIRKPSDLGYEDGAFVLPPLSFESVVVPCGIADKHPGWEAATLSERREARRASLPARVSAAASLVNADDQSWVVWCDLNAEGDALEKAIPGAVQVAGSDLPGNKLERAAAFLSGSARVLITKPSIFGFGLNFQHCARMAFVGLSDSYEQLYQATRRCWRFGQLKPVKAYIITSDAEGAVVRNIERKEEESTKLAQAMVGAMSEINREDLKATVRDVATYEEDVAHGERWSLKLGDSVQVISGLKDNCIDFSVFSPPFASLYTYSNSERDMGNCKSHSEFFEHFRFLIDNLLRTTKPGRLLACHCMNLPTLKSRDGFIGLTDFRGQIIEAFRSAGWIFHSEICIWKDPVVAQQRTKALGLLYKQLKKDSAMSRQGIPDYLVVFRKPGANAEPIRHTADEFPLEEWQKWASPVWIDINQSDTLQRSSARDDKDERHICPLQLSVIERSIRLWSNPGDCVFSPFAGIGSEGVVALRCGRGFVGVELKASYWKVAVDNLRLAEQQTSDSRKVTTSDGLADAVKRKGRSEES